MPRAGFCAMQYAAYTAIDRIAPADPDAAVPLILCAWRPRIRSPTRRSPKPWTFLRDYFSKPRPPELVDRLVNCLVPLMLAVTDPDPGPKDHRGSPWVKVLHVLALVVHPTQGEPPTLGTVRRGAPGGILQAIRASKSPQLTPDAEADIKTIEQWLKTAPPGFFDPHSGGV